MIFVKFSETAWKFPASHLRFHGVDKEMIMKMITEMIKSGQISSRPKTRVPQTKR